MTKPADIRSELAAQDRLRRTRLATWIAGLASMTGVIWCLSFWLAGDTSSAKAALFTSWPTWLATLLFFMGLGQFARSFWLAVFPAALLIVSLTYSPTIDVELIFLSLFGLPFLFYSSATERSQQWVAIAYLSILTAVALSLDRFGNPTSLPDMVSPSLLSQDTIDWSIRITVALALMLELFYFAYLTQTSVAETQKALADADAAAKSRSTFLANMSHEIRTPMNGMIGLIEVMEATDEDQRHARSIGMIRNSAFALLRILNDILDASQIDSGKLKVQRTKVELRPLVEGATQTMQSMADTHDVILRVMVDPELPEWIWSDSGRLRQILLNLLSNAVKYSAKRLTGHQGAVFLDVSSGDGNSLLITITDNGTGISDKVRATLFQPFSDGDLHSRSLVGGTGLGLSITRSLIALLGGHIRFDTNVAQGTRVRIELPLEQADGPTRLPDLNGANIVCFDILDEDAKSGLSKIVKGAGATLHVISKLADLGMLLPLPGPAPVFLLPNPDKEISDPLAKDLRTLLPDARIIRFSAAREARYGLLDQQTYQIQIFPMMGSELMRAMAILADRMPASDIHSIPSLAPPKSQNGLPNSAEDSAAQQQPDTPKPAQDCRLLLVEDNHINRMVLSKQLDLMGYPHDVAEHGEEGLQAWRAGNYDIILSDCHMPIMDGFEMAQKIREAEQHHARPHTPIIAITANALEGEGDRCRAQGMDGYLAKPVEMEKLKDIIERSLAAQNAI